MENKYLEIYDKSLSKEPNEQLNIKENHIWELFNSYKKIVLIIGFVAAFLHMFPNPFSQIFSYTNFLLLAIQYGFQYLTKIKLLSIDD